MKVFLDYELNQSGKSKFLKRLIPELERLGVTFISKQKKADVALGVSRWRSKVTVPKVLRMDGIAVGRREKDVWKNKMYREAMKDSDMVIFQSKFAKRYIKKYLKFEPKNSMVIYNGVDPKEFNVIPMHSEHKQNCIMFARWGNRKYKNFPAHMEMIKKHPDTHFWLAGEVPAIPENTEPNLSYLGWLDTPVLNRYIKMCDSMAHLAIIDWCPNAVIEARVAGLYIYYKRSCKAVHEICTTDIEKLHIQTVAKQYKAALKAVVR